MCVWCAFVFVLLGSFSMFVFVCWRLFLHSLNVVFVFVCCVFNYLNYVIVFLLCACFVVLVHLISVCLFGGGCFFVL